MKLPGLVTEPARIARYLAAAGEATELPRRSAGRAPPYWKSRVLRRQTLQDEDGSRTERGSGEESKWQLRAGARMAAGRSGLLAAWTNARKRAPECLPKTDPGHPARTPRRPTTRDHSALQLGKLCLYYLCASGALRQAVRIF
jgi:hypothetical protein